MALTLFRVLQNFETIEAGDVGPMHLRTSATISFSNGCLVRMTPAQTPQPLAVMGGVGAEVSG